MADSLFDVVLKPSAIDATSAYQSVVNNNRSAVNEARQDQDKDAIQSELQVRWDAMRNMIGADTKMGVVFRQSKIEELLALFEGYLRSN